MTNYEILNKIKKNGYISNQVRREYFDRWTINDIRDFLEVNDLNRHFPIECESTEIALLTPQGIIMQVRTCDNGKLGFWGGCLEDGESIYDGALRELAEETGLIFTTNFLQYVEKNEHFHKYYNDDVAKFLTYRFIVNLDFVPEIVICNESLGYEFVSSNKFINKILDHQQEFVKKILDKYYCFELQSEKAKVYTHKKYI